MVFLGKVLICNVGLHFVLCDIYSTCHMRHLEAWLQREEIIPENSTPITFPSYNLLQVKAGRRLGCWL